MLVVIAIIGMIAGMVGVAVQGHMRHARLETAKTEISTLGNAVDMYQLRFHRYPRTAEGLPALLTPPHGADPLITEVPEDPWGHPYRYVHPDPKGQRKYLVFSMGPDGLPETEDDLRN